MFQVLFSFVLPALRADSCLCCGERRDFGVLLKEFFRSVFGFFLRSVDYMRTLHFQPCLPQELSVCSNFLPLILLDSLSGCGAPLAPTCLLHVCEKDFFSFLIFFLIINTKFFIFFLKKTKTKHHQTHTFFLSYWK